jgi:hypothetical protein
LTVGQRARIQQGNMSTIPTDIKAIELHTAPGTTTVAIDVHLGQITVGSVLSAQ